MTYDLCHSYYSWSTKFAIENYFHYVYKYKIHNKLVFFYIWFQLTREDKLPKKICDDCVYKVELFYQFWNTTANAEKQLLQWLGEVSLEDKQGYVTNVLNTVILFPYNICYYIRSITKSKSIIDSLLFFFWHSIPCLP